MARAVGRSVSLPPRHLSTTLLEEYGTTCGPERRARGPGHPQDTATRTELTHKRGGR